MIVLILGLVVFFAAHSVRLFAEDWRAAQIERLGLQRWKTYYSLVSAAGLGLLVLGFSLARPDSAQLWIPPVFLRHLSGLLTLAAFILVAAAYVPGNRIKARIGHPMTAGIKAWALAHLLAHGALVDVLVFGAFLAWGVLVFSAARRRDGPYSCHR